MSCPISANTGCTAAAETVVDTSYNEDHADSAIGLLNENLPVDSAARLRELAVAALEDAKARDIQVFDLRDRTTFADYMIIASGASTRQVKAMAERVSRAAREKGVKPLGVEGAQEGEWILVDLADVVLHLMVPNIRAFYNLEKLWSAVIPDSRAARVG